MLPAGPHGDVDRVNLLLYAKAAGVSKGGLGRFGLGSAPQRILRGLLPVAAMRVVGRNIPTYMEK